MVKCNPINENIFSIEVTTIVKEICLAHYMESKVQYEIAFSPRIVIFWDFFMFKKKKIQHISLISKMST